MEFALILRELLGRRRMLATGAVVAALAALLSVYHLNGLKLEPRSLQYSSASTRVFVDTPSSVLGNLTQNFEPLVARATAYANFMASPTLISLIGQKSGIPGDQLYAAGPVDESVPRVEQEPTAVERNVEISGETDPYRLNFNTEPNLPTIDIYAQAPTTTQAIALANGAVAALREYVANLQSANNTPPGSKVVIRQLGQADGGVVDGGISKSVALLVFVMVFFLWCVVMLFATRFRATWRDSAAVSQSQEDSLHARQLSLSADAQETPEQESADHKRNGKTQSGERAPDATAAAGLRARFRPSGP